MTAKRKLARNSIFVTGSVGIGGILLFFVMIAIARYLGVEEYGHFSVILTVVSIVQLFADGGIVNITIRDIATQKDKLTQFVGSTTLGLMIVSFMCLAITALYAYFSAAGFSQDATLVIMMAAAFLAMHGLVFGAAIRAMEDMHITAAFAIIHKVLLFLAVLAVIALDLGVIGVAVVHLLANLFQLIAMWVTVSLKYGRVGFSFNWQHWLTTQKQALPLGGAMVLRKVTVHLDIILLTLLSSLISVGLYSSAYRILQMVEVAVIAFSGVLFPVLSRLAFEDRARFCKLVNNAAALLFGCAIPLAIWFVLASKNIVLIFFGEQYQDAFSVLQVLGIALICLMPASLFNPALAALHKQKVLMYVATLSLVTNGLLDWFLIPKYSYMGAAVGTAVTEFVIFIAGAIALARLGVQLELTNRLAKVIVATSVAAFIYTLLPNDFGIFPEIGRSIVYFGIFAAIAVATRLVDPRQLLSTVAGGAPRSGVSNA